MTQGGNLDVITENTRSKGPVMVSAPSVRRRLVGRTLRRYRESLGYRLEDAARILECDRSKISRIESGERGIRGKELRELMTQYGVAEEPQAFLALLADPRGAFGWHRDYADILPAAWQDYLILETAATKISSYDAQQIPGLLQTLDYAMALAEADPGLPDETARDRMVEAVLARQQAILGGDSSVELHLIIGEAALHQQVGGGSVMDYQLKALARVAADSSPVTVQVLPFDSGAHGASGDGSLAILQIGQAPGLSLVHLGGIGGGVCLERPDDLAAYARAFDQLRAFALPPAQSALLLRGMAGD